MDKQRCDWVTEEQVYIDYHDDEWGNPSRLQDDHYLFEMLILEGAQAGLSWITILKRREAYREAFAHFNPEVIAQFDEEKIRELKQNKGIIRNERKIRSVIKNAQAYLNIQEEYGSFHTFLVDFVGGELIINTWKSAKDVPVSTELSRQFSKDLKKRGFSFVGPVICYSYFQAIGLVQDHTRDCFLSVKGQDDEED